MNFDELINEFIEEFEKDEDYLRLKELKKIIDDKYQKEIHDFKSSEAKFENIKQYGKYSLDYEKLHQDYLNKKNILFNKEEVVLYKRLERSINQKLEQISKEMKDELLWLKEKVYLYILKMLKY